MTLSLDKICRTCMIEAAALLPLREEEEFGSKKDPNTLTLIDMLMAITSVEIRDNDGLPLNICLTCISDINRAFSFKQKCERVDSTLKSYIQRVISQDQHQSVTCNIKEELVHVTHSQTSNSIQEVSSNHQVLPDLSEITELLKNEDKSLGHDEQEQNQEICVLIYECGICSMGFPLKENYRTHMHEQHLAHLCCDTYFDSTESFDHHQKQEHGVNNIPLDTDRYVCEACHLEYDEKKDYEHHLSQHHHHHQKPTIDETVASADTVLSVPMLIIDASPKKPAETSKMFICNKCNATFAKEKSLRLHHNSNKCTEQSYPCKVCNKVFAHKKNLLQHAIIHESENKFQCKECYTECADEEEFRAHIKEHIGSKKHHCAYCGKGFNMVSTLKDHVRTHNGEQPYLCSMCGKGFSQSTNLKQHIMRHKQIKPHKCTICSYAFVSKGELDTHLRKHTGEHPFVCNVCGAGFTTSSSLAKHKRRHTGEKPYACEYCPMRFTAIGTLKNHRRTHTGERPFVCKFCDKKFTQKSDMMSHTRTHTGERPYVCTYCGLSFHQLSKLKSHTIKVHTSSSLSNQEEESEVVDSGKPDHVVQSSIKLEENGTEEL